MSLRLAAQEERNTELQQKLICARFELLDEYLQSHNHPWIVGYSGGKDSTLVAQLVFEMLLRLAPSDRRRPVHIVANDTLVESPLVISHIHRSFQYFSDAAEAFQLPVTVKVTHPDANQTFWVNLIGRGYPPPSRNFRWCTDRMKILPTSRYFRDQASATGKVILLLGVRRAESAARAASANRYDATGRLNPHNDLAGCMVFRPIVEFTTEEVWEYLGAVPPPWGGSHRDLIALYRNAQGGECPVVTQKSDAPSCGTSSSRFGCWTCTVVVKDKSLEGFFVCRQEQRDRLEGNGWLTKDAAENPGGAETAIGPSLACGPRLDPIGEEQNASGGRPCAFVAAQSRFARKPRARLACCAVLLRTQVQGAPPCAPVHRANGPPDRLLIRFTRGAPARRDDGPPAPRPTLRLALRPRH